MNSKINVIAGIAAIFMALSVPVPAQTASLLIQANLVRCKMSPILHGMMTEEINHSFDGGLYGELIQNRIMMDNTNTPVQWTALGGSTISLDSTQAITAAMPTELKVVATTASSSNREGVSNGGFWGVPIFPNTTYTASFYAKASTTLAGPLYVTLESPDGTSTYAETSLSQVTQNWVKYHLTLTTGTVAPGVTGVFALSTYSPATLWFDLVSCFAPTFNNQTNGTRPDLMALMQSLYPKFLRMPGGNYLEGSSIATRFNWDNMRGTLEQRPGHQDSWGYRSSDGFGLLEMLEWCQNLNIQPILAVYAGYSLDGEYVTPGTALAPYVQDALNEIQYATGSTSTTYGAMRAQDGHPVPFTVNYVEIGNEDNFDKSGTYDGRFAQFYNAIKAAYPSIKIIATTTVTSTTPDVYDQHFYPNSFLTNSMTTNYDTYSRNGPKVFVGEWSTHSATKIPTSTFQETLSDAAWYTGLERNSDIVIMESYAPLFGNVNSGASQWMPNLLGHNAVTSYGGTSYYMLQMFGQSTGDTVPASSLTSAESGVYYSIVEDTTNNYLYIKVVNSTTTAQPMNIAISGWGTFSNSGQITTLSSSSLTATNTITAPTAVVPQTQTVTNISPSMSYTFPAQSITIIRAQGGTPTSANPLSGGVIAPTFSQNTPVTADTDVDKLGTPVLAYDVTDSLNQTSTIVNGVTFSGNSTQNGVTLSFTSYGGSTNATGVSAIGTMSANYTRVLQNVAYNNNSTPFTITFAGLTVGKTYQLQIFGGASSTGVQALTDGSSVGVLKFGTGSTNASFVTDTFTASSTSESIQVSPGEETLNLYDAINLRNVTGLITPTITSAAPPSTVTQGSAYSFTIQVSGSPAPTFTVTSGTLPPGLTLSTTGVISGTPTATGTYNWTVTASNSVGTATQSYLMTIALSNFDIPTLPRWALIFLALGLIASTYVRFQPWSLKSNSCGSE